MSVATALYCAPDPRSCRQKRFNSSCPRPFPTYTIAPVFQSIKICEVPVLPAHADFIIRKDFQISNARLSESLRQPRLVDAANHSFAYAHPLYPIVDRHHLSTIHHNRCDILRVFAARFHSGQSASQHSLTSAALQPSGPDEEHRTIHPNAGCVGNPINKTTPNQIPNSTLGRPIARSRNRHSQMESCSFSPTDIVLVARTIQRVIQFRRGHPGIPVETELDTAHQTLLTTFRNPLSHRDSRVRR